MIQPPAGLSGAAGNPITIQAINDGAVLIDGQFTQFAVVYLSNSNSYFVFQGFNARNGQYAVVYNSTGSNNNQYKRLVLWDVDITRNAAVFWNIFSANTLCEDCAAFGTGAESYQNGYNTGNSFTCRRCWGRWEGSTTDWSGKITFDMGYEEATGVCENCLVTANAISMPASFTMTDNNGNQATASEFGGNPNGNPNCPGLGTQTAIPCPEAWYRIRADTTNPTQNARLFGSLVYAQPSDVYTAPFLVKLPTGGADVSGVHIAHTLAYVDPGFTNFTSTRAWVLQQSTTNPTDLTADRISSVSVGEADIYTSQWLVTNKVQATSLSGLNSASANPWTGTAGAQLCFRWVNQVVTTTPLWPWPMNDRIRAATAAAGAYTGPCLNCSGGRATRTSTDVQAQIEGLLGSIPSQCKTN
jgi:hypothetical protein